MISTATGKQKRLRLMLVDDDVSLQPLYEIIGDIQDTVFTVQKGGLSALKMLHDWNYELDAVVIDLSMPDMDGITLSRQIRSNEQLRSKTPPIRIYWLTGWPFDPNNPNDPIMVGAAENQVIRIYQKPYDPAEIVMAIKDELEDSSSS